MNSFFSLILLLPLFVSAKTDWTQPCFNGQCAYASPDGLYNLKIQGSSVAIADITQAAGWTVLNCDPTADAQEIRLVCTGQQEDCDKLTQDTGAVDKVVRLPENCGVNAFGRISRNWVHEDQSLPQGLAGNLRKRAGILTSVQGLAVDTNFDAVDPAKNGPVTFDIQATSIPGFTGAEQLDSSDPDYVPKVLKLISNWSEELSKDLGSFGVDASSALFSEKLTCPASGNFPAFSAAVNLGGSIRAQVASLVIGVTAKGDIFPPKVTSFGLFADITGDVHGHFSVEVSGSASADSGKQSIYEHDLPGIDIPGILSVAPSFQVFAQATAQLEIEALLDVDLAWTVSNAKLFFPSSAGTSSGGFNPADAPLALSVHPSGEAKAAAEAHIIPTVAAKIKAFGGAATADIFLNLDASVSGTMTLDGSTTISDDGTTTSVGGCVDLDAGIDVNAGADGSFFGLFDANTKFDIFNKKFDLYQKCFGDGVPTAKQLNTTTDLSRRAYLEKRAIACPGQPPAEAIMLIDDVVSGSSIVPK